MKKDIKKHFGGVKSNLKLHDKKLPLNNMGASFTAPAIPLKNQVLIDWLAWTLKVTDPDEAIKISGLSALPFTETKGGGMGYKSTKRSGNIVVFYDGSENMGVHISMSGQGCRQYETYKKTTNCWYQLLHLIASANGNITRLDIALDNVDGALDIEKLEHAIETKNIRSKFKSGFKYEKFSLTDDEEKGKTIYIGSPSSRLKFRFYDKAAQYKLEGHWVRCELQLMSERAAEAAKYLLKNIEAGELAVSVLNNYFTVINKDDSNISRCTTAVWWAAWLTTTDKMRLTTQKAIRLVDEVIEHIMRQYSASFAMCKKFLGVTGFHEFIQTLTDIGKDRMTRKHQMIIDCSNLILETPF